MKTFKMRDGAHKKLKAISQLTGYSMADIVDEMIDGFNAVAMMEKHKTSNRQLALSKGRKFYVDEPCEYGHDGRRHTKSGKCVTCVKLRYKIRAVKGESPSLRQVREKMLDKRKFVYVSDAPCVVCGGYNRRTDSGICSDCYSGDGQRIRGNERDLSTYHADVCTFDAAHGTEKYLDTHSCVQCYDADVYQEQKQEWPEPPPGPEHLRK